MQVAHVGLGVGRVRLYDLTLAKREILPSLVDEVEFRSALAFGHGGPKGEWIPALARFYEPKCVTRSLGRGTATQAFRGPTCCSSETTWSKGRAVAKSSRSVKLDSRLVGGAAYRGSSWRALLSQLMELARLYLSAGSTRATMSRLLHGAIPFTIVALLLTSGLGPALSANLEVWTSTCPPQDPFQTSSTAMMTLIDDPESLTTDNSFQPTNVTPESQLYQVTFAETGLALNTFWGLTLNGTLMTTDSNALNFEEGNGSYNFTAEQVVGYALSPTGGTITVNGTNSVHVLVYTPVYTVTFAEAGLEKGTKWTVNLADLPRNSTTDSVVFDEPKGTYTYVIDYVTGEVANPASGTVVVDGASAVTIVFSSTADRTFPLTLTETGLPTGTNWTVAINRVLFSSTNDWIQVPGSNGSYNFSVGVVPGYVDRPGTGVVRIAGAAAYQAITFSPTYYLTFTESGLPSGSEWSVTLGGVLRSTISQSVTVSVPAGTYEFTVQTRTSYEANFTTGYVTVTNTAAVVVVEFSHPSPSKILGIPEDEVLGGGSVLIAFAAILLLYYWVFSRRKLTPSTPGSTETATVPALGAGPAPTVTLAGPAQPTVDIRNPAAEEPRKPSDTGENSPNGIGRESEPE